MKEPDAVDRERAEVQRASAELLDAVNASDAERCAAVWAADGVLMPPHHPCVQGQPAIVQYFHNLFSRSRFRFAFIASHIHIDGATAVERITYTAAISPGDDAPTRDDLGKGIHVYRRQPDGSWKLTHDIWNSDQPLGS